MGCVLYSDGYKVAVPGSLMLFGEHAVLHGKQAIVVAINQYIKINLVPNSGQKIEIISTAFGKYVVTLAKFKIIKPYDYVLTAIKQYLPKISSGFTLHIDSEFPPDIGFGSSAAVTVATLSVLHLWLSSKPINHMKLYREGIAVVRAVQGSGSGADVAASVFGGVISYKMRPIMIKKLNHVALPLSVIYSGSKMVTAKVVAQVEKGRKNFPVVFSKLYEAIDCCVKEAVEAISNNDWLRLGRLMNIHQGLQDALGVNNAILSELIFKLRALPNIYGAKISGAGLGDCVIGLGKVKKSKMCGSEVAVSVSGVEEFA